MNRHKGRVVEDKINE